MTIAKICILGGSGFVGGSIVNRLCMEGNSVRVLTRTREHAMNVAVQPGVEVVEANIFDPADLDRYFAGMDAVINLVGILNEDKPGGFQAVHADLPRKVARACTANGVKRLLHMSALHADSAGPSAYLRSKGQGQAAVLESGHGLDVTVFRPSVIFGPGDSFLNLFARLLRIAPLLPLASPEARFQPVYVSDVAQAFVASLENRATFGQAYDLCGPRVYTLRQVVELVGNMTGHSRRIVGLSPRLSYLQAWMMEWMPGRKLMTRDNYYSMQVDSVCACEFPAVFGIKPQALEVVAPEFLSRSSPYRGYRSAAGR
jgi:uncharacterized protein YbjT (DUF2867 family)